MNKFNEFKKELISSESLQEKFKADPVKAVNEFYDFSPIPPDAWIYRIVVGALGLAIIFVIAGLIALILSNKSTNEVSTIFTAIASGAIGALAGLLAPSPRTNGN